MATSVKRAMIPLTDEVVAAMRAAAEAWPEAGGRQSALLRRLVIEGGGAAERVNEARRAARRTAIRDFPAAYPVRYPDEYVKGLREEWPG
jgi:hypothetical protein